MSPAASSRKQENQTRNNSVRVYRTLASASTSAKAITIEPNQSVRNIQEVPGCTDYSPNADSILKVQPRFSETRAKRFRETVREMEDHVGRPHSYDSGRKNSFSRSNSGSFQRTLRFGPGKAALPQQPTLKLKLKRMDKGLTEVHHIFYDDTAEQHAKMLTFIRPSSITQKKKSMQV